MSHRTRSLTTLLGRVLAVIAMLVVVTAAPGHVLEDAGAQHNAVAEAAVLGRADAHQADWDHHIHGGQCAEHCAAHVLDLAPQAPMLAPSPVVRTAWRSPAATQGRSIRLDTPQRPPRA